MSRVEFTAENLLGAPLKRGKKLLIVGAGISGLLLAYALEKRGFDFEIWESGDRAGGILGTRYTDFGMVETAANGVLLTAAFEEMCRDLNLEIMAPEPATKKRFLVRNGKPTSRIIPYRFLPKLFWKVLTKKTSSFDTIEDFGLHHLGAQMTYDVMEAGLQGIYGAKTSELSFRGVLPGLENAFKKNRRLFFAARQMFKKRKPLSKKGTHGFKGGMQDLVNALADKLSSKIYYNKKAEKADLVDREVVLTCPAYAAAAFFEDSVFSQSLTSTTYANMLSCTSFYSRDKLENFEAGFGCLIPSSEGFDILGVLYNSCIFKHRVSSEKEMSFTTISRDFQGEWSNISDTAAKIKVHENLKRLFQLAGPPLHQEITRWPQGIPIYSPELVNNWSAWSKYLETNLSNIRLFGNYTGEISIRGIASSVLG